MPRAKTILQSEYPYNISARCINREWFHIPMEVVWNIFCEELTRVTDDHKLAIHSFVLMTNHFHLIATTPQANISQCMHQFMRRTSRRLTREGNRINQTFAGRHYKCILQHHNYYLNAYKYNYRNPVTVGICATVEEYPYSTFQSVIGKSKAQVPLVEDTTFIFDPLGTLQWLNTAPDPERQDAVRCAMKHPFFKSKKDSTGLRPLISETDIL